MKFTKAVEHLSLINDSTPREPELSADRETFKGFCVFLKIKTTAHSSRDSRTLLWTEVSRD